MMILSVAWIVYIHTYNEHFQKLIDKGEDTETAFAMTSKRKRGGLVVTKRRVPMQVAPEFEVRIKNLQKTIMIQQGKLISMRDLTKEISINHNFDALEKKLLNVGEVDIKFNLDRREK